MQVITNNQQNLNFKWNRYTHKGITIKALESFSDISTIDKNWISGSSVLPDFKRKNLLGWENNAHFFYPDSKNKSYGIKSNTVNNGLYRFMHEIELVKKTPDRFDRLQHLGMAIHFLQDAQTPVHTEKGSTLKKLFDAKKHKDFERGRKNGATARLGILTQNYTPTQIEDTDSFEDMFVNTARNSQQYKVKYTNKKDWLGIQQACFNRSVDVTKKFISKMLDFCPDLFKKD